MMTIVDIVNYFKNLGREEPHLTVDILRGRIAKTAVQNKILDEDVFELAESAYNQGKGGVAS